MTDTSDARTCPYCHFPVLWHVNHIECPPPYIPKIPSSLSSKLEKRMEIADDISEFAIDNKKNHNKLVLVDGRLLGRLIGVKKSEGKLFYIVRHHFIDSWKDSLIPKDFLVDIVYCIPKKHYDLALKGLPEETKFKVENWS